MRKISFEGLLGILLAIVAIVLDQAGVRSTVLIVVLLCGGSVLCVHSFCKSDWATVRAFRVGGVLFIVLLFIVFGGWVFTKKRSVEIDESREHEQRSPIPTEPTKPMASRPSTQPEVQAPKPESRRKPQLKMGVAPPLQKTTPQPPPIQDIRIVSQEWVPSTDANYRYQLKVVVQTNVTIQPVSIVFECNEGIDNGSVWFSGDEGEMFIKERSGVLMANHKMYLASFESPAFTPEKPMILTLWSSHGIKVIRFEQVPFRFP